MWILSSDIRASTGDVREALDKEGLRWTSQGFCKQASWNYLGRMTAKMPKWMSDHHHADGGFLGFSEP